MDPIYIDPLPTSSPDGILPPTFTYWTRKREIRAYYENMNDIKEFMHAYPDVNFRYFIQPEKALLPAYDLL